MEDARPAFYKARLDVSVGSQTEELQGWEKGLLKTLRFVANIVDFALLNFTDFSEYFQYQVPPLPTFVLLSERSPSLPNFRPQLRSAAFSQSGGGLSLTTASVDRRKCSVARRIVEEVKHQKRLRDHASRWVKNVKVRPGESLWEIAQREMLDGRYHLALAQFNGLPEQAPLRRGATVRVPSLAELNFAGRYVVQRGDSAWKVKRGDNRALTDYLKVLRKKGRRRSVIYPGELAE